MHAYDLTKEDDLRARGATRARMTAVDNDDLKARIQHKMAKTSNVIEASSSQTSANATVELYPVQLAFAILGARHHFDDVNQIQLSDDADRRVLMSNCYVKHMASVVIARVSNRHVAMPWVKVWLTQPALEPRGVDRGLCWTIPVVEV